MRIIGSFRGCSIWLRLRLEMLVYIVQLLGDLGVKVEGNGATKVGKKSAHEKYFRFGWNSILLIFGF